MPPFFLELILYYSPWHGQDRPDTTPGRVFWTLIACTLGRDKIKHHWVFAALLYGSRTGIFLMLERGKRTLNFFCEELVT